MVTHAATVWAYAAHEVERDGVHQVGGGVWGVPGVLAGSFCGGEQVRREMDGWPVPLEIHLDNGESIVGTAGGFAKARDCRRKPEECGRWINDGIDGFNGAVGAVPRSRRRI